MVIWQFVGQAVVFVVLFVLLAKFLAQFKADKKSFAPLFAILAIFTFGFALRLTGQQALIDFGYYFTEISYLFTYVLFTACLILGQKKYWRVL